MAGEQRDVCPVPGCGEPKIEDRVRRPWFCARHWMLLDPGRGLTGTTGESFWSCAMPSPELMRRVVEELVAFEAAHVCDWDDADQTFWCGEDAGITLTCRGCLRSIEPRPCGVTGCDRRGDRLCDYPVGRGRSRRTCDLALCDAHAVAAGPDVDFCPAHAVAIGREAKAATELQT